VAVDRVVDLIDEPVITWDARMHPITLARFFRVLSDPTRLRLLQLLDERSRTAGELVTALDASQPRVSTHLACLRHCGFVTGDRRGREVVYRLQLPDVPRLLALAEVAARPRAEHLSQCSRIAPDWA
jgi:ArsR family transcriptional regulator, cadmium/lead-responsive transcriptional repressor